MTRQWHGELIALNLQKPLFGELEGYLPGEGGKGMTLDTQYHQCASHKARSQQQGAFKKFASLCNLQQPHLPTLVEIGGM